jgi:Asp-tRNA(Asn)/Glu-tRNA(Gln) amidotransferase A subunit family amidase
MEIVSMSQQSAPGPIVDRLRANLRAAGIAALEADIQGMIEKGFLNRPIVFEQIVEGVPADRIPDYLAGWADGSQPELAAVEPAGAAPHASHRGDVEQAPLYYRSIGAVGELIRTRQISPVELAEQLLERIAQHDAGLNAYQLVLADRARASAQQAEQAIAAGGYRGPLHGIPLAIKDLLDLAGTPTSAGSRILAGSSAGADATAVARLEAAGAVILGKTRLSEFAYSPGSNNAHYGPTRNPWNPAHDSGGSSSGSAAAVAAGLAYAALGSDTGGSIRIPAALCGVVGLKPTFGRISLHGAVPLSWSLDHLGPLTRSVADAALVLELLAGADPRDLRTHGAGSFRAARLEGGVAGLRVGALADDGSGAPLATDEAMAAWRSGLAALESQGARLIPIDLPEMEPLRWLNNAILAQEAAAYHLPWLRERLEDYGEFMRQRILSSFAYGPGALVRAQQARALLRERCAAIFERVDLLSTPSQPDGAPPLNTPASTNFTGPFNILGWPAISVPVGLTGAGLPLGLQLVGKPWGEATLLRAARVVEAAFPPLKR